MSAFEPLQVLEVPPLPSLDLEPTRLQDQLVSSTFLSPSTFPAHTTTPANGEYTYRIEPLLLQDAPPNLDPVLDSFTKRVTTHDFEYAHVETPVRPTRFATHTDAELDSPGPSKRPIRRSASDSSLSSNTSSIWDEDLLLPPTRRASVRFRGAPAKSRILDLAFAESTTSQQPLLEAIHERLSRLPAIDAREQHLAPVHPSSKVLHSLIITATTGTSSEHFQWDADSASFVWSATFQHRKEVRRLRRLVKEQNALHTSLLDSGDIDTDPQEVPAALTQPWIGEERILGWSNAASNSVTQPFLDIGALLRRIDDRILSIHRGGAGLCNEAPALAAALDLVVTWFKSELSSHTTSSQTVLKAYAELAPSFIVLKTLGNLLSVSQPRVPPFRPLTWLSTTHATLSHLHAHLAASLAASSPALPSAVLAFLLDRTSRPWRESVARWVGFPGFESRGEERLSKEGREVPWSGAVVDWALDERGEEDVGYTLKPSAVPSFLGFKHARAFLEAGRALRLLKKAAPNDHPLVKRVGEEGLELPSWKWAGEEVKGVEERIGKLKGEIGRWRRSRRKVRSAPMELNKLLPPQATEANAMEDDGSVENHFEKMSRLFTALPGTSPLPLTMQQGEEDEESALLIYLASSACPVDPTAAISQRSFDRITSVTLIRPFEQWARLTNTSLISVFFTDLGLGTYLETCKQFLLLGSPQFERQVVAALFDSSPSSSALLDKGVEGGRSVVAMNPRLTAEGTWPPNDTLLSSALNTAVIETVSSMRAAHEERGGDKAVSLAYKDLDERLSFAIIPPAGGSGWKDPSSIAALDWLTLSFHPPPLISPLLTGVAQARYQRLWNLLLRIKRCKVAMRAAWQVTFKGASAAFTFDFRTRGMIQQLRWECMHFLDTWGGFVGERVEGEWRRFMARLHQVRTEVSDELASSSPSSRAQTRSEGEEKGEDWEEEEVVEEERGSLELKDVFSLARYHERVLDRMLSTCFLKSKQRRVLAIINDLLQTCLDFSQLCMDFHSPSSNTEPPGYDDFANLHTYFRGRMDTLVQALMILKDRSRPDQRAAGEKEEEEEKGEGWGKRRADVELEKQRLVEDEEEDLRLLDVDEGGREVGEEGSVEVLLTRLNGSGFYAEMD